MKAIIPVAGAGTKLRPHTYTQPKALIPLAGKTVLSIIVDQLAEAGIKEFVFIIGYLGDKIQDYVKEHYPDLSCHFVLQSERQGLGHAIFLTKDHEFFCFRSFLFDSDEPSASLSLPSIRLARYPLSG